MKIKLLKVSDDRLFERLKHGDESVAQELYNRHADAFFHWARKTYRQFPEEEIRDMYQEAFLTFYYQVKDGKLSEIRHSVKSYLFSIGKNFIRNELRKKAKFVDSEDDRYMEQESRSAELDLSMMANYQQKHQAEVVKKLLIQIGDPCKTVLELAFFRRFSPEAIASHMGYTTEASARVRKVRCLKQMGDLLEKTGVAYDQIFE